MLVVHVLICSVHVPMLVVHVSTCPHVSSTCSSTCPHVSSTCPHVSRTYPHIPMLVVHACTPYHAKLNLVEVFLESQDKQHKPCTKTGGDDMKGVWLQLLY